MKKNTKKGISVVLATAVAVTPFVAAPKAYAISDVNIEADDDTIEEQTDYTIEFTLDEALSEGDYIEVEFDDEFDLDDVDEDSDVSIENEDGDDILDDATVSGQKVKIYLSEDVEEDEEISINIDNVINPDEADDYTVSIRTTEEDWEDFDDVAIDDDEDEDDEEDSEDFDVTLGDSDAGEKTSIELGEIDIEADDLELEEGETVYVYFPTTDMLPDDIDEEDVEINGYEPESVEVSDDDTVEIELPDDVDGDDFINIEFSRSAGIKNPKTAGDYTFEVEYDDEKYESEEFEIKKSVAIPTIASNFAVTLTDTNAGARSSYSFTLDFGDGKLESNKEMQIEFPAVEMVPPFINQSSVTVNGEKVQNLYVNGNRVYFKTPYNFTASKTARVNFAFESFVKNPNTPGSYSIGVTYEGKSARSANFNIVSVPIPVDNSTATLTLTKNTPNTVTGVNAAIKGVSLPLAKNADYLELALPAGFKVPGVINNAAVTVNGVAPTYVTVKGQNIDIYPSQDIAAGTPINVVVSEAAKVTTPAAAGLYSISVYSSKDTNLLYARPVTIANPMVPILKFKINNAVYTKYGKNYPIGVPAYVVNGNTLVSAQLLKNGLGLSVTYSKWTATIVSGKNKLVFKTGSNIATVNGKTVKLPVAVQAKGNMPMLPLRFISDTLGYKLSWDGATSSVVIGR